MMPLSENTLEIRSRWKPGGNCAAPDAALNRQAVKKAGGRRADDFWSPA
jgi:hypothetical protein